MPVGVGREAIEERERLQETLPLQPAGCRPQCRAFQKNLERQKSGPEGGMCGVACGLQRESATDCEER